MSHMIIACTKGDNSCVLSNSFPLHIKFKVHESSIMEFPDWVQVKEKTIYSTLMLKCI